MKHKHWRLFWTYILILTHFQVASGFSEVPTQKNALSTLDSYTQLEQYINSLKSLRTIYQNASNLAYQKKLKEAEALLSDALPIPEEAAWHIRTLRRRYNLRELQKEHKGHLFLEYENPELGIRHFESIENDKGKLELDDIFSYSQCLIETGQYSKAKQLLQTLVNAKTASDWKKHAGQRIETIKGMEDGQTLTPEACSSIFLKSKVGWYKKRLGSILMYWECSSKIDTDTLTHYFDAVEDNYGKTLALRVTCEKATQEGNTEAAANSLLTLAHMAYQSKQNDEADALWKQIQENHPQTPAWSKAVYYRGTLLKERRQYNKAIEQFQLLLDSNVNDMEKGECIIEAYGNYQPKALWEIGDCYLAQSHYEKALASYQSIQNKHPFQCWCGTCQSQYEYQYVLCQGICYEHLGDYCKAIENYIQGIYACFHSDPVIHIRLADLYESAGQIADLMNILDEIDTRTKEKLTKDSGEPLSEQDELQFKKFGPGSCIRRVLEIRNMGSEGDYEELVSVIQTNNRNAGPEELNNRKQAWQAIEAAKVLAKYPDEAIEHLETALNENSNNKYLYCAIGLCGTQEAEEILKQIPEPRNYHMQQSLKFSKSIQGQLNQVSYLRQPLHFPEISKTLRLPKRLAEVDRDVAFEESIPKTMKLDLSTPQATIKSMFTAALIRNIDMYMQCISDNEKLSRSFRQISKASQNRLLKYQQSKPVYHKDNQAKVKVTLNPKGKPETVIFILAKINGDWLITDFEESR